MRRASPEDTESSDRSRLRTLSLDLLARPPLEAEVVDWLGRPRQDWLDAVLSGAEFWQNWLEEQLYYFLLVDGFRPTSESLSALSEGLRAGELGVLEVLHRTCLSSSFDRRNPGPDTFVSVVMEQLLGMTVQSSPRELEIGKKLYDGRKGTYLGRPGGTQSDVVRIAMEDPRAPRHLIQREHVRSLRFEPEGAALEAWSRRLSDDPLAFPSIVRDWFLSDSFTRRLTLRAEMPNRLFLRALFVDLMGRLPDEAETQKMRTALDGMSDSGPLRALLARLLLDSGKVPVPERSGIQEPVAWIRGTFERFLGRPPGESELSVFVEAMADPACRTTTVLYALVSHPEYQRW